MFISDLVVFGAYFSLKFQPTDLLKYAEKKLISCKPVGQNSQIVECYRGVGKMKLLLGFQRMDRLADDIFLLRHMGNFPRQLCTK